jgi:hypothetical protein
VKQLPCIGVEHNGADRHWQLNLAAVATGSIAPLPVPASLGFVFRVVPEMEKCIVVFTGDEEDVAPASAITSARTPSGNVLLPAEG